jgi:hypothetical protein
MSSAFQQTSLLDHLAVLARRLGERRRANGRDPSVRAATLARVDRIAWVLDSAIVIPGIDRRVGVDALLGVVPVAGDVAGGLLGCWILIEAYNVGAPAELIARMAGNLVADTAIGAIPIAGDLLDAGWKANKRNAELLRDWLERQR